MKRDLRHRPVSRNRQAGKAGSKRAAVSSFKFQVPSFEFRVSSVKCQVSSYKLQVSSFKFQVSGFKFRHLGGPSYHASVLWNLDANVLRYATTSLRMPSCRPRRVRSPRLTPPSKQVLLANLLQYGVCLQTLSAHWLTEQLKHACGSLRVRGDVGNVARPWVDERSTLWAADESIT